MRSSRGERTLATLLIVPTALVVLLLAVVQYRWSADVSNATGQRLADSLQMSMMGWQLNLFRDVADVCLRLRLDGDEISAADLAHSVERFTRRQAATEYPDLVAAVYLLSASPHDPVLAWNHAAGRFDAADDARDVTALRDALQHVDPDRQALKTGEGPALAYTGGDLTDWKFSVEPLAVMRSIATESRLFRGAAPAAAPSIDAWIVLRLDVRTVSTRVLPSLARRYFSGPDGLDYEVAVVAGAPRRVLYSSDSLFGTVEAPDADGRMNIFGRAIDGGDGSSIRVFQKAAPANAPSIAVGTAWLPLIGESDRSTDWQLMVRHHRGGSLGAFVADVERRNLTISFGLILLLVASVAVWIVIGSRVRRLARLEMNFVTAVSHDLRTPLAIISSAADNLAQGVVRDEGQLTRYGTAIGTQARKLSDLVEQVLLFGTVRQSTTRYVARPIDVAEIVETTLAASAELIAAAGVSVQSRVAGDLPAVMSDPLGLAQCLQNLITNALKYGGERRWLGVSAERAPDGQPEVLVSVSDRGIGIAPNDLRYIFEPFYRSPSVVATKIQGSGLGLAVARGVVEAMNGRLTVVSTPGEGSTFTLHLPTAE